MRKKGFTLIELIMVLALVAIAAAIAAPFLLGGKEALTVPALARKVLDDIRYAQSESLIRSNLDTATAVNPKFYYRIRFNVADPNCAGANQYTIVNDADNNGTWGENPNASSMVESARYPATGEAYFCVSLETGDYAGFTVTADFGGSVPGVLQFDTMGVPYDSDGNKLAAAKTVTVARGSESALITVTPNTGRAILQ